MGLQGGTAKIHGRFMTMLGIDDLMPRTRQFMWTHINFMLFTTIPGIFINTFFFRIDGKISTIAVYNAICLFGQAIVMQFTSGLALKISPVKVLRIGIVLNNAFFISLLLLQQNAARYMVLLGLINAVAWGFYWQGYNIILREFSHDSNLDRVISVTGMASSLISLVIPPVSGCIIALLGSATGYTVVFLLALAVSVYAAVYSMRIGQFKVNEKSNLSFIYKYVFKTASWRLVYIGEFFRGVRDSSFPVLLTILLFKFVGSEATIGVNNMMCGAASVLAFYIGGRFIRPGNRIRVMLVTAVLLTSAYLVLFVHSGAMLLFWLAVVNAFGYAFIMNTSTACFYSAVGGYGEEMNISQIMAVREVFFAAGRVVGLLSLIFCFGSMNVLPFVVLALNVSPLITSLMYRLAARKRAAELLN